MEHAVCKPVLILLIGQRKLCHAGRVLTIMTAMKEDGPWGPLLHQAGTEWRQNAEQLHDTEIWLTLDNVPTNTIMLHLNAIFFPSTTQVCVSNTHTPIHPVKLASSAAQMQDAYA